VEAEKAVALEVDGEYCGKTPVEFQVVPQGLEVIIP
jgi:diacylglycerol kinase family enzyme